MTGQVEISVIADVLRDGAQMEAAMDRASDVIYERYQKGGPCVAGDLATGTIHVLTFIDDEEPDAWLPQLRVLCLAVEGPIQRVNVAAIDPSED